MSEAADTLHSTLRPHCARVLEFRKDLPVLDFTDPLDPLNPLHSLFWAAWSCPHCAEDGDEDALIDEACPHCGSPVDRHRRTSL